jgi:hypothetical protein
LLGFYVLLFFILTIVPAIFAIMSNRGGNYRYSTSDGADRRSGDGDGKRFDEKRGDGPGTGYGRGCGTAGRGSAGRGDERRGDERRGDERRGDERRGGESRGGESRGDERRGDERRGGGERRGDERRGGESRDGGKKDGKQSRRNKSKIVPCSAAAKGECKRKDCRFFPCCNERGNEPKYVDNDESAPMQTYAEPRYDAGRTHGVQQKFSIYDESKGYYNANGKFVYNYTGPVQQSVYRTEQETIDSITYVSQKHAALQKLLTAALVPAVNVPAPVVNVPAPVVKAPVAPVVAVKASLTFNQGHFNRFMQMFDVNCGNVDTLIDSDPEFRKYIRANEGAIKNDIKQLRAVMSKTRRIVDAPAWIQDLFAKKVLDINNFPGDNITEAAIQKAVHCGVYRVFRTYQTGDAVDNDTVSGFVLCMFGCMVASRNKSKIVMPSFAEFSCNVFHGVYV